MFPPESPPPTKYQHVKLPPPPPQKNNKEKGWVTRFLQVSFIILGIAAIVILIVFNPRQKTLVCDKSLRDFKNPLTAFGSCKTE